MDKGNGGGGRNRAASAGLKQHLLESNQGYSARFENYSKSTNWCPFWCPLAGIIGEIVL